jgi:hypothetical protein
MGVVIGAGDDMKGRDDGGVHGAFEGVLSSAVFG